MDSFGPADGHGGHSFVTHRWIDTQAEFEAFVDRLAAAPRYALDTEFHRERTYYPKLALLQFATPDGEIALIDPLAVDLAPLGALFSGASLAVLHAAQQDLDVLSHACGAIPQRMFDTQIAAGFVGYGTPSLVSLLSGELRVNAAKGDRLTDWLRRPLTSEQRDYAASDVAHLLDLHDRLERQLDQLGRSEWVAAACEELRLRPTSGTQPENAWVRLRDVRVLKPKARGVARAVAEWRERRAMAADVPIRQILPDLAVLGIAQKQPRTPAELAQARGVDERHSKGAIAKEILAAVELGSGVEVTLPPPDGEDLERHLRPAVTLVAAWLGDLARRSKLDVSLLATRADIVAIIRGDADARLAGGWRANLVGDGIGRAALTFDGGGGLRLVDLGAFAAVE
jgi:ribonuclease D